MTTKINAKQLFTWDDGCGCGCTCGECPNVGPEPVTLLEFSVAGVPFVSNRYTMIELEHLDGYPVAYPVAADWFEAVGNLSDEARDRATAWMSRPVAGSTNRWFYSRWLAAIENAGYRVAALEGEDDTFGIVADGKLVGGIMALAAHVPDDEALSRGYAHPKAVDA